MFHNEHFQKQNPQTHKYPGENSFNRKLLLEKMIN